MTRLTNVPIRLMCKIFLFDSQIFGAKLIVTRKIEVFLRQYKNLIYKQKYQYRTIFTNNEIFFCLSAQMHWHYIVNVHQNNYYYVHVQVIDL